MTEPRYFSRPSADGPGTLNPVYDLLDHPVALGRAEDVVLTGPPPDRPLVNGREVSDPRLLAALATPIELDRAEVLDRSAKLAGVLRTLGATAEGSRLAIAEDVPGIARTLSVLAAVRIGLPLDLRPSAADVDPRSGTDGPGTVLIHSTTAAPVEAGRASIKVVRSRFEGVGMSVSGHSADLDQAMRDSRVEFAAVAPLPADAVIAETAEGAVTAADGLDWLRSEVLAADCAAG